MTSESWRDKVKNTGTGKLSKLECLELFKEFLLRHGAEGVHIDNDSSIGWSSLDCDDATFLVINLAANELFNWIEADT